MYGLKFWKKFLMPCGLCATVPITRSQSPQDRPQPCNCKKETKMLRPSELPIYPLDDVSPKDVACCSVHPSSVLEQQIGSIRRSLQGITLQWHIVSDTVSSKIHTGMEHSQVLVEYLHEKDNVMPRLGAVAIGGLTGLIVGLRGGFLKRSLYFSTGALSVGAICYPRKAQEGFQNAKYYANIGYNFIYGVKPGSDDQTLSNFKLANVATLKVPTTLSELRELIVDTGSAIVNVVGSVSERTLEFITENKEATKSVHKTELENSKKAD